MKYVPLHSNPEHGKVVEIKFDTCKNDLICKYLFKNENGYWWGIFSHDLPTRFVCLKNDKALKHFATKYGYMDNKDCVNYNSGKYGVLSANEPYKVNLKDTRIVNSIQRIYKPGIPQRARNSGLCWYSAMCFCCFFCRQMRQLIRYYCKDKHLINLIEDCLSSPEKAEELRHLLFYKYALGDDPKQSPEKDGQNGFTEFITLCGKLNIPLVRYFAPNLSEFENDVTDKEGNKIRILKPQQNQPSLLVVRCFRTRWKPKLRIVHNNIKYKLASVLIGSEHCGHQIGASTCDLHISRWACADSDAQREGISPVFWKVKRYKDEKIQDYIQRWWYSWGKMIPVTLFNSGSFCDFSPHNRSSCNLEKNMNKIEECQLFNAGVVNSDFVYIHANKA
tara:strand:- start:870 stop:2042 length:1173 start_codon:yes stop_codon:yes gene_type:complete